MNCSLSLGFQSWVLYNVEISEALGKLLKSWCLDHTRINEIKMSGEDSSTNIFFKAPQRCLLSAKFENYYFK